MFASPEFDNVPASAGSHRAVSLSERVEQLQAKTRLRKIQFVAIATLGIVFMLGAWVLSFSMPQPAEYVLAFGGIITLSSALWLMSAHYAEEEAAIDVLLSGERKL